MRTQLISPVDLMNNLKWSILALSCAAICGCGGGGSSASSSPPAVIPLDLGTVLLDTSQLSQGQLHLSFPDAIGDNPQISELLANGSNGNGSADLSLAASSNFDIRSDTVTVHFPTAGNYSIRVVVTDAGDSPQQRTFNVSIPSSDTYTISGLVQDGPLNNTIGVRSNVRLYWNPLGQTQTQIAVTQSNEAANGAYSFANLVGPASYFGVRVDGGTH